MLPTLELKLKTLKTRQESFPSILKGKINVSQLQTPNQSWWGGKGLYIITNYYIRNMETITLKSSNNMLVKQSKTKTSLSM